MPLNFQNIQVPIGAGVDQKTDQRTLPPGKVTSVTNGVFTKIGSVQKRFGMAQSASLSGSASQLFTFQNEVLGSTNDGGLFSFSPNGGNVGAWKQVGSLPNFTARRQSVVQRTHDITNADIGYTNGFTTYAWMETTGSNPATWYRGDVFCAVDDAATGARVIGPMQLTGATGTNNIHPRIVTAGTSSIVLHTDLSGNLNAYVFKTASGQAPALTKQSTLYASPKLQFNTYDACSDGNTVYVALFDDTLRIAVQSFDAGTLTPINTNVFDPGLPLSPFPIKMSCCVAKDAGGTNLVVTYTYQDNTGPWNQLTCAIFYDPTTMNRLAGPTFVWHGILDLTRTLYPTWMGVVASDRYNATTVFNWTDKDVPGNNGCPIAVQQSFHYDPNTSTIVTDSTTLNYYVQVVSKPFFSGSRCYVLGQFASTAQGTYFLFDTNVGPTTATASIWGTSAPTQVWNPIATIAPRQVRDVDSDTSVNRLTTPNVVQITSGTWSTVGLITPDNLSIGRAGVIRMDLASNAPQQSVTIGGELHVASGVPSYYDGTGIGEMGFNYYPENTSFTPYAINGNIEAGTYIYAVTYEWIDNQGQWRASNPVYSLPVLLTSSISSVGININSYTITNIPRSGSHQPTPYAVVYRSTKNGTNLQRLSPTNTVTELFCNPLTGTLQYLDRASDADVSLSTQPVLYTVGNVQPNYNPPSAKYCCVHVGRLWLAGTDDPKAVWYSKQLTPGEAPAFTDVFQFNIDEGGDITGLASLDSYLIVFKSDRIFYVVGQGPSDEDTQNDLSPPTPIPSTVGCINARSIVRTDDGILFQSRTGIHLLARNMETVFIGAPVVDLLAQYPTITSAVVVPDQTQVRFTCVSGSSGVTLVYDYTAKAWTSFSIANGVGANCAVLHNGVYKEATTTGLFLAEDNRSYLDAGQYVPMTLETAWVAPTDMGGFARFTHVNVMGSQLDNSTVKVSVGTDYNSSYDQSVTFFSDKMPGPGNPLEVQVSPAKQKAEAMRVKVEDTSPLSGTLGVVNGGQGISLSRLQLRAGALPGLNRINPKLRG